MQRTLYQQMENGLSYWMAILHRRHRKIPQHAGIYQHQKVHTHLHHSHLRKAQRYTDLQTLFKAIPRCMQPDSRNRGSPAATQSVCYLSESQAVKNNIYSNVYFTSITVKCSLNVSAIFVVLLQSTKIWLLLIITNH